MTFEILSNADLEAITGKKRYSAQVTWFKNNFLVEPVCRPDGSIMLTKAAFELLLAKRMGVAQRPIDVLPGERPALQPVFPDRKPKKS